VRLVPPWPARVVGLAVLAVLAVQLAAAGCDCRHGPAATDSGAGGVSCGALTCAPAQVCCIDCDGTGTCGPPGSVCPGAACPAPDAGAGADAGVSDAGTGITCGAATCAPGQICCIDCDGTATCDAPGAACTGPGCPPVPCATGTCRVTPDGPCEPPGGPVGNGCCACGTDDLCSELCRCAAPDTPVATPDGERPIAALRAGDLVYSVDGAAIVAVPVLATRRTPVRDHVAVRVTLDTGAVLLMSPVHPTADGRLFRALRAGDRLGDARVERTLLVPYAFDATYDVLPASDTGVYFAAGVPVGSTLAPAPRASLAW